MSLSQPLPIVCLPDQSGHLDRDWLAKLQSHVPRDSLYTLPRLAKAHGLKPANPRSDVQSKGAAGARTELDQPHLQITSGLIPPPHMLARLRAIIQSEPETPVIAFTSNLHPQLNPFSGLTGEFVRECVDSLIWALSDGIIHPLTDISARSVPVALIIPTAGQNAQDRTSGLGLCHGLYFDCPALELTHSAGPQSKTHASLSLLRARLDELGREGHQRLDYFGLDDCPVTLHVTHDWGGGIDRWIHDMQRHDGRGHHLVLSARAHRDSPMMGQWLDLFAKGPGEGLLHRQYLSQPIADTAVTHPDYNAFMDWVIERYGVSRIIVSSLIGHSLDALTKDRPTIQILHDFYPASPVFDADPLPYCDPKQGFDLGQLIADRASNFLFENDQPEHWRSIREHWLERINSQGVNLIAPTAHVDTRWQTLFDQQLPTIHRISHGFDCPAAWAGAAPLRLPQEDKGPLRLLLVGRLSSGKGLKRLIKLVDHFQDRVHFTVLGAGQDGLNLFGLPNVDVILEYDRDTLPSVIQKHGAHAALFLSRVPETWNYVLSELSCLGLPAVAPNEGSFAERVTDGVNGVLYPPDVEGLIACIEGLISNADILSAVSPLSDEPSMAESIAAYDSISPVQCVHAHWVAKPLPNWESIYQKGHEIEALQRGLSVKRAENEQLKDQAKAQALWLDRLDRTVKTRSQWALRTQKELEELRQRLEQKEDFLTEEQDALDGHVRLLKQHTRQLKEQYLELEHQKHVVDTKLQQAQTQVESQSTHIASLQQHNEMLQGQLAEIFASKSWRLTRPLRATVRVLTTLKQRRAWNPVNWPRQTKRFVHAIRVHGWRATLDALQYHRPTQTGLDPAIEPVTPPDETQAPSPVTLAEMTSPGEHVTASVIIPVYNNVHYTAHCLASIYRHPPKTAFEVVVVNDCSDDGTTEFLNQCDGIRVVHNESNLGFIGSCNAGAAKATGSTLVFLNNDTEVTNNWLDALLETFEQWPQAGIVGARLVYPDGRLQEAGGIVFNDGSGWNYGRLGPSEAGRVCFVSEADYVSGACLAISRELFQTLGGFDDHYAPAYYEDTDLCFKVRAKGLSVLYQPRSTIIHFEGISSGTDESSGIKRYQAINREKFKARWGDTLADHPEPVPGPNATELIERARHHRSCAHVLIVDAVTPQPDHDSGSMRMVAICEILVAMGYRVSFMPINLAWDGPYSQALQMAGVEVIFHPEASSPKQWLKTNGNLIDWVLGSRYYVLSEIIDDVRLHCPKAKILFDTVDLHFLREQRKAELSDDPTLHAAAKKTETQELGLIEKSDTTFVVSEMEQALLHEKTPQADIQVLSNIHTTQNDVAPFEGREGILFVGGYQHPPNLDAACWLTEEILPALRESLPDVQLHLIGSKMPEWLKTRQQPGLQNHGFVEDMTPFLSHCLVAVAPLRYGAGVKGKVNQAMAWGLPVVATPCAAEGIHTSHDHDILLANSTENFVEEILRLHNDQQLWATLSSNGQKNVERYFSRQAAQAVLARVLAHSSSR